MKLINNDLTSSPATLSPFTAQTNIGPGTDLDTVGPENTIPDLSTAEKEACRDIHCDFEATCELGPDNFPRCTCQFDCASAALVSASKPVCASDLQIYPSLCAMKMEACQRQEELRLRPLDLCQGLINTILISFITTNLSITPSNQISTQEWKSNHATAKNH